MAKRKKKPIIALGLDPGDTNFGYNIVAVRDVNDYVSVEDGLLYSVQSQQTEVSPHYLASVVDDVLSKLVLSGATFLVIERYHPRGGTLARVEYVNQVIGAILCAVADYEGLTVYAPTASAWKPTVYTNEGLTHADWFPGASVIHAADAGAMVLSMLYRMGHIEWPED